MKALRSQVRTAGVMAAGRRPRPEAIIFRKLRAAPSSRSLFCPQDGSRSTSNRRRIEVFDDVPLHLEIESTCTEPFTPLIVSKAGSAWRVARAHGHTP